MNWTGEMEILDEVRCAVKEECIRCKFYFKTPLRVVPVPLHNISFCPKYRHLSIRLWF